MIIQVEDSLLTCGYCFLQEEDEAVSAFKGKHRRRLYDRPLYFNGRNYRKVGSVIEIMETDKIGALSVPENMAFVRIQGMAQYVVVNSTPDFELQSSSLHQEEIQLRKNNLKLYRRPSLTSRLLNGSDYLTFQSTWTTP